MKGARGGGGDVGEEEDGKEREKQERSTGLAFKGGLGNVDITMAEERERERGWGQLGGQNSKSSLVAGILGSEVTNSPSYLPVQIPCGVLIRC